MTQGSTSTRSSTNADEQRRSLWIIFLSGPVVYTVYFLVVWALAEFGCFAGIEQLNWFGFDPIRLGVVVLTVIAAILTLGVGIVSFRRWHAMREGPDDPDEDDPKFMLFVGMWMIGLFTVTILMTAIPMLFGVPCEWI
jgi:heme/copper-type cytochrome/quinol oxidase subunit 2